MSYRGEKSNRAAGFVSLAGAGVLTCAAAFPWITVTGPTISFKGMFDFAPTLDSAAVDGVSGGVIQVLAAAGVAALLALAVMATTRSSNVLCRLGLFIIGGASAFSGGYLIYSAKTLIDQGIPDSSNVFWHFIHEGVVKGVGAVIPVEPGQGAYAMALGGLLVAVGGLVPARIQRPAFNHDGWTVPAPGVGAPFQTQPSRSVENAEAAGHLYPPGRQHQRRRWRWRWGLAVFTFAALIALAAVLMTQNFANETTVQIGGMGLAPPQGVTAAERQCVDTVTSWESSLIDGLPSTLGAEEVATLSQQFAAANDQACPTSFVTAHQHWVQAWQTYSGFLAETKKFHAPWDSEWSESNVKQKKAAMIATVQAADDELNQAVVEAGGQSSPRTWSTSD
jgi:hypothetical protein